jgi:2-(1,2-epoxy-1,2-dihydrophenyl)acetyl-CoA isomerase
MEAPIVIEKKESVAYVLLNRPQYYNALDMNMATSLANHLLSLSSDDSIRGIIVTGRGKAFCGGGDLKWVCTHPSGPAAAFHDLSGRFHQAVTEIRNTPKPVIAAINGAAAGGGFSLALACDFRVMARTAVLKQAYTSNGLSIDGGGSWMLPRLVGLSKAMEIMALDETISAEDAIGMHLVNQVVDADRVIEESDRLMNRLLELSLHSFGWSKRLLHASFDTPLEAQMERERVGLSECGARDGREGIAAFIEKRKPRFVS